MKTQHVLWTAQEEILLVCLYNKFLSYKEIEQKMIEEGYFRTISQCKSHLADMRKRHGMKPRDNRGFYKKRNEKIVQMYKDGAMLSCISKIFNINQKTIETVLYQSPEKISIDEQREPCWSKAPNKERTAKAKRLKKWRDKNHAK